MSDSAEHTPNPSQDAQLQGDKEPLPITQPETPIPEIQAPVEVAAPLALDAPHTSGTIPMAPLEVEQSVSLSASSTTNDTKDPNRWAGFLDKAGTITRNVLLVLSLVVAIIIFLQQVNQHYPIKHWLFWTYAKVWGYCALFALAIASSGNLFIRAVGGKRWGLRERTTLSLASGTLIFFFVMFIGGLFRIYNHVFAVVMPIVVFLPGAPALVRHVRRVHRHVQSARKRTTWRPSPFFWMATGYGALSVALIYFAILSPRNVAYDSFYYHLGLAQEYTVQGGIRPALEAWLPAAIPHLSSVLYAWAFLMPGLSMFERVICAAHVEFVLFLFTLAGLPVLVRRLVPGADARLSWVSMFLFPGIFIYDSALSVAADHINAFWAVPLYLMLLRTLRSLDVARSGGALGARNAALLAAFTGGAILTKYQAMYLIAFPAVAVLGAATWYFGRSLFRRDLFWPTLRTTSAVLATSLLVGLVVTSPHWLKNLVWYGDPFFPYLSKYTLSSKWIPDTAACFQGWNDSQHTNWRPQGDLKHKLWETAQGVATFAFLPHDWSKFHGKIPVFGCLFSLSVLVLPFLQKTKRIWTLVIATHMGVAVWYWTLHQDRYLQVLLPWMAVAVSATLICLWRAHWTAKPFVVALVAVQIIWGGDAYFIPAHAMTGNSAAPITAELLSQGMKGKYTERYAFGDRLFEIGRDPALPQDAHVLIHEHELRFGMWRPVISDQPGLAYAYRYDHVKDHAELYAHMRKLEVTHIITRAKSHSVDSLGSDLQFFAFIKRETKHIKDISDWGLFSLLPTPPTKKLNDVVAYLGCGKQYGRGLHPLSNLSVRERQINKPAQIAPKTAMPMTPQEMTAFMTQADFLVTDNTCKPVAPSEATLGFVQIATRGDNEVLWARNR